jgi:hypothetical protein
MRYDEINLQIDLGTALGDKTREILNWLVRENPVHVDPALLKKRIDFKEWEARDAERRNREELGQAHGAPIAQHEPDQDKIREAVTRQLQAEFIVFEIAGRHGLLCTNQELEAW